MMVEMIHWHQPEGSWTNTNKKTSLAVVPMPVLIQLRNTVDIFFAACIEALLDK